MLLKNNLSLCLSYRFKKTFLLAKVFLHLPLDGKFPAFPRCDFSFIPPLFYYVNRVGPNSVASEEPQNKCSQKDDLKIERLGVHSFDNLLI